MPSNRWVVLALLFAVRVSTGIQYQAVASLSPQLMSGFVLSIADIGLLIGLYHAPGTILAFPGGAIGAWLGDKPVVLIGLALMAIGEIAAATAPTWPILMGARIVAGTGGILLNVMIIKMVADWVHQQRDGDGDGDHRQFGTSRDCAGACHDSLDRQFRRSSAGFHLGSGLSGFGVCSFGSGL